MLWVALHFPRLPPDALEPIAAWACQFTPKVSLEPPRELLLEVQGSLRLLRRPARPCDERLAAGLRGAGLFRRAARPRRRRARRCGLRAAKAKRFEALPVEVTGLRRRILPQHRRTPPWASSCACRAKGSRSAAARMSPATSTARSATLPEPRAFFAPPPRFAARLELPAPVSHAEGAAVRRAPPAGAARGLARRAPGRHPRLRAEADSRGCRRKALSRSAWLRPRAMPSAWRSCCASAWAAWPCAQPVEAMRLEAGDFVPLPGRSGGMFGDAAAEAEDWARLVERLRARLGHDAVCGLATHPDHRPEHAWRRVEPGEWDPHEFTPARAAAAVAARAAQAERRRIHAARRARSASSRAGGTATRRSAITSSPGCRTPRWPGSIAKRTNGTCMASLPDYAELHCLSNFSFLRGASHPRGAGGARRGARLPRARADRRMLARRRGARAPGGEGARLAS